MIPVNMYRSTGISALIQQSLSQAKANVAETQAKIEDAQRRGAEVIRMMIASSAGSSVGKTLDIKI